MRPSGADLGTTPGQAGLESGGGGGGGAKDQPRPWRVLIVVPLVVLQHWVKTLTEWCPSQRFWVFHGKNARRRQRALDYVLSEGGICLTTFSLVHRNSDKLSSFPEVLATDCGARKGGATKSTRAAALRDR